MLWKKREQEQQQAGAAAAVKHAEGTDGSVDAMTPTSTVSYSSEGSSRCLAEIRLGDGPVASPEVWQVGCHACQGVQCCVGCDRVMNPCNITITLAGCKGSMLDQLCLSVAAKKSAWNKSTSTDRLAIMQCVGFKAMVRWRFLLASLRSTRTAKA
jgi:hypothetical protein